MIKVVSVLIFHFVVMFFGSSIVLSPADAAQFATITTGLIGCMAVL